MRRTLIFSVLLTAVALAPAVASGAGCWRPPVAAAIVDPFREPACRWCPGNRGIEYGTRPGDAVHAVAAGRVTFSGRVAGSAYVVVEHGDGMRATYGNLSGRAFGVGDVVAAGSLVGHAAGRVHFGLRVGDRYVDPAPFIGRLTGVVRLVPVDGSAAPPAGPPRVVCGVLPSVGIDQTAR